MTSCVARGADWFGEVEVRLFPFDGSHGNARALKTPPCEGEKGGPFGGGVLTSHSP